MYPDSNNPSTSYHKPTKLGKRTAPSTPDISDHETKKAEIDSNIIHENKYTSPNMKTDQDVDENEIDVKPVQRKNIYDTITIDLRLIITSLFLMKDSGHTVIRIHLVSPT
ncbi:MAG: hypothetical protein QS748_06715 [Candidatus Endonucleobacter bathymodioli]|uniref:Uncharacterized protein n=1 Tax=Candidatus Endonucleibacter bathymodioli TaxID=539814 RepID=A0AA90SSW6_9GAMM|nr:hypothetical protein [Candidatus Endonucleobacter bathymodioli]